jgi:MFS transporter, SP family, solute carrier family 2 (facilitated glucose transporter), member 1
MLFSRKNALVLTNSIVLACTILNVISKPVKSYETLMVARFLIGIACGLFTGILPVYLNEMAPQKLRGLMGTFCQLGIVFGILVTNIFGLPEILGTDSRWPYLVGFMIIPALSHIGLFFTVETPKHLFINKSQEEEARTIMKRIRADSSLVEEEMNNLQAEKLASSQQKTVAWMDFFTNPILRKTILIAVGVQLSQQFSGKIFKFSFYCRSSCVNNL